MVKLAKPGETLLCSPDDEYTICIPSKFVKELSNQNFGFNMPPSAVANFTFNFNCDCHSQERDELPEECICPPDSEEPNFDVPQTSQIQPQMDQIEETSYCNCPPQNMNAQEEVNLFHQFDEPLYAFGGSPQWPPPFYSTPQSPEPFYSTPQSPPPFCSTSQSPPPFCVAAHSPENEFKSLLHNTSTSQESSAHPDPQKAFNDSMQAASKAIPQRKSRTHIETKNHVTGECYVEDIDSEDMFIHENDNSGSNYEHCEQPPNQNCTQLGNLSFASTPGAGTPGGYEEYHHQQLQNSSLAPVACPNPFYDSPASKMETSVKSTSGATVALQVVSAVNQRVQTEIEEMRRALEAFQKVRRDQLQKASGHQSC